MDEENEYLCGYLMIKGLTDDYPHLTTFFHGEIIGQKHPFLTRKWDADEEIDKKHWVRRSTFSLALGAADVRYFCVLGQVHGVLSVREEFQFGRVQLRRVEGDR